MRRTNTGWAAAMALGLLATLSATRGAPAQFAQLNPCGEIGGQAWLINGLVIAADGTGNVFFAEGNASSVRKITPGGMVTIAAGNGSVGFGGDGGPATAAMLGPVSALAADASGNLFIAESGSPRIRRVTASGTISTVAGNGSLGVGRDGEPATGSPICPATALAADGSGNLFIASGTGTGIDSFLPGDYRVRKVTPAGVMTTIAGTGQPPRAAIARQATPADGGAATATPIWPKTIAVDAAGNLFVFDGNARVQKVTPAGVMTAVAGNRQGSTADGEPAISADLSYVSSMAVDGTGNLFVAESLQRDRIRKVSTAGIITTVAGNGSRGLSGDGIKAATASLSLTPVFNRSSGSQLAVDGAGNLFFVEFENNSTVITRRIRKVDTAGMIATVFSSQAAAPVAASVAAAPVAAPQAAPTGSFRISGQVTSAVPAASYATRNNARGGGAGAAASPTATLYLVQRDSNGSPARMTQVSVRPLVDPPTSGRFDIPNVAPGSYELFASLPDINSWGPSAAPGQAVQPVAFGRTSFDVRGDMTNVTVNVHPGVDLKGRVTVDGRSTALGGLQLLLQPDARAATIQPYQFIGRFQPVVGADGTFTIPALPEAQYRIQVGMTGQSTMSLADILQDGKSVKDSGIAIAATPPGMVEIVLKTGGGPGALSSISPATAGATVSAVQAQTLSGTVGTRGQAPATAPPVAVSSIAGPPAGDGGPAVGAELLRAAAIAADASGNLFILDGGRVRKVAPDGVIRTIAGNGAQGHKGDGGPATGAGFEFPADIAVDANGNLYIADNLGNRVRKVTPAGVITTVAGTGEAGFSGDGGPATAARLQSPVRIAVDAAGNLYIADSGNARIRKVSPTGVMSSVAGTGKPGFRGDGGTATAAQIDLVTGLGVDAAGNVYIADAGNARIRKVTARGAISTIAGTGKPGFSGDGGPAAAAQVDPFNLAVDGAGNVFIVEINRIRKIATDGVIRTIAGNGTSGFSGDGGPALAAQLRGPSAVAVDPKGNLYIADALNGRIRKVAANGAISVVAGSALPPASAAPNTPAGRGNAIQPATVAAVARGNVNVAAIAAPPLAPSGRPVLLQTRLESLTPPPVKDCGHVPRQPAATVTACAEGAIRGKELFLASFQQQGIDSQIVLGIAATSPGKVVQVMFDSDPSGGSNAGARVSAPRDCVDPQFTVAGATVRVVCK